MYWIGLKNDNFHIVIYFIYQIFESYGKPNENPLINNQTTVSLISITYSPMNNLLKDFKIEVDPSLK